MSDEFTAPLAIVMGVAVQIGESRYEARYACSNGDAGETAKNGLTTIEIAMR